MYLLCCLYKLCIIKVNNYLDNKWVKIFRKLFFWIKVIFYIMFVIFFFGGGGWIGGLNYILKVFFSKYELKYI